MRQLFYDNPNHIYLNSGSLSRCPKEVIQTVTNSIAAAEQNPTRHLFSVWPRLWEAQQALAELIQARAEDIYLRPNVTQAMNDFIMTVPLAAPGEILISDLEYGAIENLCRRRAETSGLSLRKFHLPSHPDEVQQLTRTELLKMIEAALNTNTQMLMLSHVMTTTGLVLPILEIAKLCKDRGIIFAVDGAHGPGAVEASFAQFTNVDFYGGNVHKWLMGPKGTGFGWIHPKWHDTIWPTQIGWTSYESFGGFASFAPQSRFAGRYLTSNTLEFAPYLALPSLLKFWQQHQSEIQQRLAALKSEMHALFRELGRPYLTPSSEDLSGPILSIHLPDAYSNMGYSLMEKIERECALTVSTPMTLGRTCLRITPHVYNDSHDLRRALQHVKTLIS